MRRSLVVLFACLSAGVTLSAVAELGASFDEGGVSSHPADARAAIGDSGTERSTITDVRGRTVELPAGPRTISVDDGRYVLALALLLGDPTEPLAGWPHDVNRIGPETYERYAARFPRLAELPHVSSSAASFSLEQTVATAPDVAVFSLGRGPTDEQLAQLERAGVVPVFLDFFMDPLSHMDQSLLLLGEIVGARERAEAFVAFRAERRSAIRRTVERSGGSEPTVFFETHAGMSAECCTSPGSGNVGVYIDDVGGHNIGADVLPGPVGRVSLEYLLERDPDVYVATGGPHLERTGGLVLGGGYAPSQAREALRRMTNRPGFSYLSAVRAERFHGLAHQLLNSPLDIVAVELLAQWIHPSAADGLDPPGTLARINRDFLAVPIDGTYWTSLNTP